MSFIVYYLRLLGTYCFNFRGKLRKAPDFVVINLEGDMDLIALPGKGLWARLNPPPPGINQLRGILRQTAKTKIKGVVFKLADCPLTPVQIEELQRSINHLKSDGKKVIVWGKSFDTNSYWLASNADKILLQPGGRIANLGVKSTALFMADALARVGLKLDALQISPYKSAADRLTRSSMSHEVREMTNWLLDARYHELVGAISAGRGLGETDAQKLVNQSPYTDQQALHSRVIDGVINWEELPQYLGTKPDKIVPLGAALKGIPRPRPKPPGIFALVRVTGAMVDGRSARPHFSPPLPLPFVFSERAGDLTVTQQIEIAKHSPKVKGVLLYVDSGGGSATASEAMASALEQLAGTKPLVALMGSVAASGGYYVTTPAHWVVASPSTITGSIGVLTAKLVDQGLMAKLFINRETISRGRRAEMESWERCYTPEERALTRDNISRIYELFIARVAKARKITPHEADKVGGGRVWTGKQALAHGLVDELGGLDAALDKLKELTGTDACLRDIPSSGKGSKLPTGAVNYALESIRYLDQAEYCLLSPAIWQ